MTRPAFTQRHYESLARAIKRAREENERCIRPAWTVRARDSAIRLVIEQLDTMFRQDNPNYKPTRFRDACRPEVRHGADVPLTKEA